MSSKSPFKNVGNTANSDYFFADPNILIVTPRPGTLDNPGMARINVDFQSKFARKQGKQVGLVIVMSNLLGQDAETRRIYTEGMLPSLFYAGAMVVANPLSRAIGSFFMGLSKPQFPMKMVDSVETGIQWLKTISPAPAKAAAPRPAARPSSAPASKAKASKPKPKAKASKPKSKPAAKAPPSRKK